jgi:hypothetical protein
MTKPNQQTYIYERVNNTVYARLIGDTERTQISTFESSPGYQQLIKFETWRHICELAETNETIRQQLDRLLICYNLVR